MRVAGFERKRFVRESHEPIQTPRRQTRLYDHPGHSVPNNANTNNELSPERQRQIASERRFFLRCIQDDEEFKTSGRIAGIQVIQIEGTSIRRQSRDREGKPKLTFVIFFPNQRHALIQFLREARRGWRQKAKDNDESGFNSTILGRHLSSWVTAHLRTWYHDGGWLEGFAPIKPDGIRRKFNQVSAAMEKMAGAHSINPTGEFLISILDNNLGIN